MCGLHSEMWPLAFTVREVLYHVKYLELALQNIVVYNQHMGIVSKSSYTLPMLPSCVFAGAITCNDVQHTVRKVVNMQEFDHPHVMSLLGVCLDPSVGIVMPYMANGSILDYLKRERTSLLVTKMAKVEEVD